MKLDKRACRHAANVPLHISLNAGVLYTERVKYLVTAAVKLLGGHRVLAVYFYECERLKANLFATTFMTGAENYTLAAGLYSLQATEMSGSWPVFAAASLVVSLPILIVFFAVQRHMTSGLTAGGVKG